MFATNAGAEPGAPIQMCCGADVILPSPHYRNYPLSIEQAIPGISKKFVFDFLLDNVKLLPCMPLSLKEWLDVGDGNSITSGVATPYRCPSCLSLLEEPLLQDIIDHAHDDNLHLSQ
eukprot:9979601-Ditylum_brightwellii.AAC.1